MQAQDQLLQIRTLRGRFAAVKAERDSLSVEENLKFSRAEKLHGQLSGLAFALGVLGDPQPLPESCGTRDIVKSCVSGTGASLAKWTG